MVKQISLDTWQTQHLADLLLQGSSIVEKTGKPIVLFRQTIEEQEDSYEEMVCTLTNGFVIEQIIISGGFVVPSITQQNVFSIQEFPQILLKKSRDRFLQTIDFLEEQFK